MMEERIMSIIVVPAGEPIFSEMATTITITDESGGEYVEVQQHGRADAGKVAIEKGEWPALRGAIDRMITECREQK